MLRVVQWATGGVGEISAKALRARPDLELVGTWVHSESKEGRDLGELLGEEPWGITTTRDIDEVLALRPDCVAFCENGDVRQQEVVDRYCRLLESGINVVSTSVAGLVHRRGFDPAQIDRIQAAGERGDASLFVSGIEPGFAGDHLALLLSTCALRIRRIRVSEIGLYSGYPVTEVMRDVFGFGQPLDEQSLIQLPGVQAAAWSAPVLQVADALGVQIDEIRETFHKAATPRNLSPAMGEIQAGTCGAVRFETIGVVDGEDAIVIEHVNRMAPDLAPEWPNSDDPLTYRIAIEGEPDMRVDFAVGNGDDFSEAGMVATTMRMVNAIPFVCDAPPGLVIAPELPLTVPRGMFDPHAENLHLR